MPCFFRKERGGALAHSVGVVIVLRARVPIMRGGRRVAMHRRRGRDGPPDVVAAHRRQILRVTVPVHDFGLPLVPRVAAVLGGLDHAGPVARAAAAVVLRHGQLRGSRLAELHHPVEFVDEELQESSASVSAAEVGGGSEDVVEDAVDAIGVGTVWVAVDFHEEEDAIFVLVVCSGVPGPRSEVQVGVELGAVLAYCEAGLNEPVGS